MRKSGGHPVTSDDPHADRALPPGGSQPPGTESGAAAHKYLQDAAVGQARPGPHARAAARPASIQPARSPPLTWKTVVTRAMAVAAAGVAIYLVLPTLTEVLASWPRMASLDTAWLDTDAAAALAPLTTPLAL